VLGGRLSVRLTGLGQRQGGRPVSGSWARRSGRGCYAGGRTRRVWPRWGTGGCNRCGLGGEAEAGKQAEGEVGVGEEGHDGVATAAGARENVLGEHPAQELGPWQPARADTAGGPPG